MSRSNASSLPPRLPHLSDVLRRVKNGAIGTEDSANIRYTIAALSYRGYWTSRGRPSQRGLELDAEAALSWAKSRYVSESEELRLVLWGQSIGAGVATTAAANDMSDVASGSSSTSPSPSPRLIKGLILETPFISVRSMLTALYPQRWLPYRYLGPFLWNLWDNEVALRRVASTCTKQTSRDSGVDHPQILILQAGQDELVPSEQAEELETCCRQLGFSSIDRRVIVGALHTEVMTRCDGQRAVAEKLRVLGGTAKFP